LKIRPENAGNEIEIADIKKLLTMTTQDCSRPEMLSALFDGQAGAEKVLANWPPADGNRLNSDWNCYQLIGDALRSSSSVEVEGADPVFLQRVSARLSLEMIDHTPTQPEVTLGTVAGPTASAANDQQFRWKLVAGFASLSVVAVLAWTLTDSSRGASSAQQVQISPQSDLASASTEGPMIRDPRLEELLSAHKQMGRTSLQVPSGFVRNAGFEASRQAGR
jgi:sigma-E factor negative regulatory protein RseA